MRPSQLAVLTFIVKMFVGLLSLQLIMALTGYIYIFVRPYVGHWPAFGIGAGFGLIAFAVVIRWMGRQYNEWYNR